MDGLYSKYVQELFCRAVCQKPHSYGIQNEKPFGSSLYFLFLCWFLMFFHLFQVVHYYSPKYIYDHCFKNCQIILTCLCDSPNEESVHLLANQDILTVTAWHANALPHSSCYPSITSYPPVHTNHVAALTKHCILYLAVLSSPSSLLFFCHLILTNVKVHFPPLRESSDPFL